MPPQRLGNALEAERTGISGGRHDEHNNRETEGQPTPDRV